MRNTVVVVAITLLCMACLCFSHDLEHDHTAYDKREPYFLRYSEHPLPVTSSKYVTESLLGDYPANITVLHVHLALTNDTTQMVATWLTRVDARSTCQYGTKSGMYTNFAYGSSHSYFYNVGYIHDVIMTGLTPETKYFYRCGDASYNAWSSEFSFISQPVNNNFPNKPYKFAIYGDMGVLNSQNTSNLLLKALKNHEYHAVVHVGDISYADDYPPSQYESVLDEWFVEMENVTANVPYMVCPGNHEYPYNFTVYKERFRMPGAESGSYTNMYHSWNYGNIHFIALSTEPLADDILGYDSVQYRWLEEDLRKAHENRDQYPWIIVYAHRPMYCSAVYDGCMPPSLLVVRNAWSKIFKKYKVDLAFWGHMHAYERTYPVYDADVISYDYNDLKGLPHFMVGAAGCNEGLYSWQPTQPDWSAFRISEYGFGELQVFNSTHADWKYIQSSNGEVLDYITISRKP